MCSGLFEVVFMLQYHSASFCTTKSFSYRVYIWYVCLQFYGYRQQPTVNSCWETHIETIKSIVSSISVLHTAAKEPVAPAEAENLCVWLHDVAYPAGVIGTSLEPDSRNLRLSTYPSTKLFPLFKEPMLGLIPAEVCLQSICLKPHFRYFYSSSLLHI